MDVHLIVDTTISIADKKDRSLLTAWLTLLCQSEKATQAAQFVRAPGYRQVEQLAELTVASAEVVAEAYGDRRSSP